MRRASFLAALAALVLASPALAQDAPLTGLWDLTWETPRGVQTVVFDFKQDGMYVTGTARMRMGEVPVGNGMLHGDQLMFTLETSMGERTLTRNFVATVTGDTMSGTLKTPRGETPFTGKRKEG